VGEVNEWRETKQWHVYGNPATASRRRQWQQVMAMEEEEEEVRGGGRPGSGTVRYGTCTPISGQGGVVPDCGGYFIAVTPDLVESDGRDHAAHAHAPHFLRARTLRGDRSAHIGRSSIHRCRRNVASFGALT
jgi:hypothetical protein